jgi:hypothetical protein
MDYKQKYLKYKNKYIKLKQIGLGKPTFQELSDECDGQIRANPLSGCTDCIYQHVTNEADAKNRKYRKSIFMIFIITRQFK